MTVELNRDLVEALASGRLNLTLAADVVVVDQAQAAVFDGREAAVSLLRAFYADGFSDTKVQVQRVVIDERSAVLELTFQGRHNGRFFGIPPTRARVSLSMVIICQIRNGQIIQATLYYDAGTLLRQLNLAL